MNSARLKHEKFYQSASGQDVLRLLVHRSQKIHLKNWKNINNFKTPVPQKAYQSPIPGNSKHNSKSPSYTKLPNLKAPIALNSVEFPINYYDQLANLVLPEVNKTQKRPIFNSVNPRVANELKSQKLSEAGIIEFKPNFPRQVKKEIYLKKQTKITADFSTNTPAQLNLVEKIRELLPVAESQRGDEEDLEEKKVENRRIAKNLSRIKKNEKIRKVDKDVSMISGWTFQDSESFGK